jgi:hypothetical protein
MKTESSLPCLQEPDYFSYSCMRPNEAVARYRLHTAARTQGGTDPYSMGIILLKKEHGKKDPCSVARLLLKQTHYIQMNTAISQNNVIFKKNKSYMFRLINHHRAQ